MEPKFPPNEEYSHNNYIPNTQPEDFYRRSAQNYGYGASGAPEHRRYAQESFPANSSYGCSTSNGVSLNAVAAVSAANTHGPGYTPSSSHGESEVMSPTTTTNCQPTNSPPHTMPQCTQQQNVSHSPSQQHPLGHTVNSNMNSSNSTTNSTSPPVIYPWMKRVHLGSSSKYMSYSQSLSHGAVRLVVPLPCCHGEAGNSQPYGLFCVPFLANSGVNWSR